MAQVRPTAPRSPEWPALNEARFHDETSGGERGGSGRCGEQTLVGLSCKRRGFCPSCLGRKMADTAAHLVDRVLPWAPYRQ
ncbi:MAG: transposase zinc-binding domain-containing protein, partial [Deltaproteobacteria bacterium]|nr:transposase zinc-binding domain-containing protein [Deltaproteobacteria bacterium]